MSEFRPLRIVLCIYECLRLAFLVGAFLLVGPAGTIVFPWLALISPGALFLLMAVFWCLNISSYRVYAPLYTAGKGLSVITTVIWFFFTKNDMIRGLYLHGSSEMTVPVFVFFFMVLGDMLSAWLVNAFIREKKCE